MTQRKFIAFSSDHWDPQSLWPSKARIGSKLVNFFWDKRLALTRNLVDALQNQGNSLVLMNIALNMLALDLIAHKSWASDLPMSRS